MSSDRIPDRAVFSMELKESRQLLLGHLTFYDSDGQIATFVATSGLPGYQSPRHYHTRRKGLCPPYRKLLVNTNGYHLNTIGVEGMFFHVTPDPIPGYGRSEIGIHRDANVDGSSGCIVIRNEFSFNDKVVPLFELAAKVGISRLPLEIDYKIEGESIPQEIDILARTMYGEARGEDDKGKAAVAWVVRNRAERGGWWGDDIAEVCLKPYQFSCWNQNDPNRKKIERLSARGNPLFQKCIDIASDVLRGKISDLTKGANHYHAPHVKPSWAKSENFTVRIGNHLFYKL
jgi:N-acetylmuramoyl-L-alanine amidase